MKNINQNSNNFVNNPVISKNKKTNNKGVFLFIIIVVFVLIIATIIFLSLNPKKNTGSININKKTLDKTSILNSEVQTLPKESDWKIYEHKGYGFSFRYPKGFSLETRDPNIEQVGFDNEFGVVNNLYLGIYPYEIRVTSDEFQKIEDEEGSFFPIYTYAQWNNEKNYLQNNESGECNFIRIASEKCRVIKMNNIKIFDRLVFTPPGGSTARLVTFYSRENLRFDLIIYSESLIKDGSFINFQELDDLSEDSPLKQALAIISTFEFKTQDSEWVRSANLMAKFQNLNTPTNAKVMPIFLDFNGDLHDEFVIHHQKVVSGGSEDSLEIRDSGFEVYRWDGSVWTEDFTDKMNGVIAEYEPENFFRSIDFDGDGMKEAVITLQSNGTGRYRTKYLLKWNGNKISKFVYPEKEIKKRASEFLRPNEVLGAINLEDKSGYVAVCTSGDTFCESRQSAANPLAVIKFELVFENNKIVAENFARQDY